MVEVTYKRKANSVNTYNIKLEAVAQLDCDRLKALCRDMGIPFLCSAAPRLITARLEKGQGNSPICDSILRKPILHISFPADCGQEVVNYVVNEIAKEKGIQPDEVNIPKALPDSYGFYEGNDPACGECPYKWPCEVWTITQRPACYRVFYHSESAACKSCLYAPWCGTDLER